MRKVFIAWERSCTRSENLSNHIGARAIFVAPFYSNRKLILARYIVSFFMTLFCLIKERAEVVFTLNLPPFLVVAVYLYAGVFKAKYVLDSHSGAFNNKKWSWFLPIYRYIASRALLNINTNEHHKSLVESWGGRSIIVSDVPIVHSEEYPEYKIKNKSVAIVVSYAFDEPIKEIWGAVELVPEVNFYITGNSKKLDSDLIKKKPENITFTGFLTKKKYFGLLKSVDGVLVLTTRDHTMQRGAYEALSLEKPIVTSNWPVLVESFGESAVYVSNTAKSIAEGIQFMFENLPELAKSAVLQKKKRMDNFKKTKEEIMDIVSR